MSEQLSKQVQQAKAKSEQFRAQREEAKVNRIDQMATDFCAFVGETRADNGDLTSVPVWLNGIYGQDVYLGSAEAPKEEAVPSFRTTLDNFPSDHPDVVKMIQACKDQQAWTEGQISKGRSRSEVLNDPSRPKLPKQLWEVTIGDDIGLSTDLKSLAGSVSKVTRKQRTETVKAADLLKKRK